MRPSITTSHLFAIGPVLVVLLSACADSAPSEPIATSISLGQTAVALDAIGATSQIGATVRDQNGIGMPGAAVSWSSSASSVATVSGTGLVTAVADGVAQITATSGSASASATVTVAQAASAVDKLSGDAQTATAGTTLPVELAVRLKDSRGNAVPGMSVAFAVSSGGGTVNPASATTDANGQAATAWTLPTVAGSAPTVTATPATGSGSAQFTATVVADVAHAIAAVSGDDQTGEVHTTLPSPLIVVVQDQYGNPVAGQAVTFTAGPDAGSVAPTGETTGASGEASTVWTLGAVSGTQTVEAVSAGLQGSPVAFSANVTPPAVASIESYDGDGQTGLVGYATNRPPAVMVRDASGTPFPGASVTFAVQTGGGSVVDGVATSDADGLARPGAWVLGAAPGANALTATVAGTGIAGNPVTFSATAAAQAFDIQIRFVFTPTAAQQAAFDAAEAYWERVIFGNLPQQTINFAGGTCGGATVPALSESVDDLVIYAELVAIDGIDGVLGQAGPCLLRTQGLLPALGGMKFDTADLAQLEASGQLDEVILHEVGHVLGYGTLWPSDWLDLLADPSDPSGGGVAGADAHFTGEQALWAFDDVGGTSYALGAKVPVENDNVNYDTGSLDAHWRESVFDNELMTPELNSGLGAVNPLSKVTAASMGDMGYTVNYAGADTYALPGPPFLVAGPARLIRLAGDVWRGPMHVVDAAGRTVRVLRWQ